MQRKSWAFNKCEISVSVPFLMRWTWKKTHLPLRKRKNTSKIFCFYQIVLIIHCIIFLYVLCRCCTHGNGIIELEMLEMWLLCSLSLFVKRVRDWSVSEVKYFATYHAMRNPPVSLSHNLLKVTNRHHQSN